MGTFLRVVLFSCVFVGGLAVIYWFTSYEDAGTTMLAAGSLAYAMLCGYVFLQVRRVRGGPPLPEDSESPLSAGGGSEGVGYFPAASVWPPAMAMGAVLAALGLVFGFWFFVLAAIFFIGAIIGYAVEASAPH
jgi:hypothetical protein